MPFDASLADRVRDALKRRRGLAEKKMFGGVGFLLNGNMCLAVWKEFLIVRVGSAAYIDALKEQFVREFDITGKPMTGWVMVEPEGLSEPSDLKKWAEKSIAFVKTLSKK
jgi:TfoX/Sxy family transcriptional regulator of competence genes